MYSDDNNNNDYSDEIYDELAETVQCYCDRLCPFGTGQGICDITVPGGKCFASTVVEKDEYGVEYPVRSYGCLSDGEMALLQCKGGLVPHVQSKSIICCDTEDFCNKNLQTDYTLNSLSLFTSLNPIMTLICSFIISFLILLTVVAIFILKFNKKSKERKDANENIHLVETAGTSNTTDSGKDGPENFESVVRQSSEIVSGSEFPVMVERTIVKEMEMHQFIGKGQYGEVWLAKWRGEKVAVKLFFPREEQYWIRETEIYQTVLMRHENILGYIAADVIGTGTLTKSVLITEYYERGSLYDHLQSDTLTLETYLRMARGIASGLTHLHTEICGTQSKPSVAHCNISSKHIFVKRNGECCIADFGLAVQFNNDSKETDLYLIEKHGFNRYMAPEILDESIDLQNFESLKMTDIYSYALVLWEMTRRVKGGTTTVLEYEQPFQKYLSNNPSFEEIREIVCVKKVRPDMPKFWTNKGTMSVISQTICEMWHENPAVRLTALRVKKTLSKLIPDDVSICLEDT